MKVCNGCKFFGTGFFQADNEFLANIISGAYKNCKHNITAGERCFDAAIEELLHRLKEAKPKSQSISLADNYGNAEFFVGDNLILKVNEPVFAHSVGGIVVIDCTEYEVIKRVDYPEEGNIKYWLR